MPQPHLPSSIAVIAVGLRSILQAKSDFPCPISNLPYQAHLQLHSVGVLSEKSAAHCSGRHSSSASWWEFGAGGAGPGWLPWPLLESRSHFLQRVGDAEYLAVGVCSLYPQPALRLANLIQAARLFWSFPHFASHGHSHPSSRGLPLSPLSCSPAGNGKDAAA